jgi:hypothetical protein
MPNPTQNSPTPLRVSNVSEETAHTDLATTATHNIMFTINNTNFPPPHSDGFIVLVVNW